MPRTESSTCHEVLEYHVVEHAITEQVCGTTISSTQVSRATTQLDGVLEAWRNRPLGGVPSLDLDVRYEIIYCG